MGSRPHCRERASPRPKNIQELPAMSSFGVHDMMKVEASSAATLIEAARQRSDPPRLSPLAERLASLPVKPTYSPLVLEGIARFTDFALVIATGLAAFH